MRLDRYITVQFVTKGKTGSGSPTETWGGDVNEWARVEPIAGAERYSDASEQVVAVETLRFTIRFRSDVRPGVARIQHDGRTYNIRRAAETSRRQWLELDADCKLA